MNEAVSVFARLVRSAGRRRALGLAAGAAALALASGTARAQDFYPLDDGYGPMSPREVVRIVRREGFAQISRPYLSRGFYVVDGTDANGWRTRLLVDARSGAIVGARPLRSAIMADEPFRPYGPTAGIGPEVGVEIDTGRGASVYVPVPLEQRLPKVAALPPVRPSDEELGLRQPLPHGLPPQPPSVGDEQADAHGNGPAVVLAPPEVPPVPPAADVIGSDGDEIGGPASGKEILPGTPF